MPENSIPDEEISLKDFFASLWAGRWIVIVTTILFTAAALTSAMLIPKKYEAEVQLIVASSMPGSGGGALGGLTTQLGGLASLVGLGADDSQRAESIAVLQSHALSRHFIEQFDLLPQLYPKLWDADRKQWRNDAGPAPTSKSGSDFLRSQIMTIDEDGKTGLVTLTIRWIYPEITADWANKFVALANDLQRSRAIEETERNIDYLNDQANKTNVIELRQAIYSLLQSEIQKGMLARGSKQFAYRVVDEAVAPLQPAYPNPVLWTLAGLLAGGLLSSTFVFARAAFQRFA